MRYWYAYTGESLIAGHGRAIRRVISDARTIQPLLDAADKQYAAHMESRRSPIPESTFIAALLAPIAMQEIGITSPPATVFSSVGQMMRIFDGLDIGQAAVNLFNGRIASAYSQSDMARRLSRGFSEGELLFLPRDAARLHTREIMDALPGIAVFLLSQEKAQQKAFANYLRRGTPPGIPDADIAAAASLRPILKTWEREARLTNEILMKGCVCTAHP